MPNYVIIEDEKNDINATNDTCFICLEDSSRKKLKRCCTQCYSLVHDKCWARWDSSRKLSAFRSMILGEAVLRETGACTICRSGYANIEISDSEDDGYEKRIRDMEVIFTDRTLQTSFRVVFNRLYGNNIYSYYVGNNLNNMGQIENENSDLHSCNIKTLLVNGLFLLFLCTYAFLNGSFSDNKSIITLSLWVYITFILQFLILTGIHRRQVLNEFMISEPNISDEYSTVDNSNIRDNNTNGYMGRED
ncbi:ring finger domain protein [Cryptosporidium ryanae]|uniref:ring finger domain protein n=1 Tax=Cryptosporidium ryanae TaxID=515981 RepID=UPI003519ED1B|nr:ring finger domain protein [Cryptosporidium ryanae]